MRDVVDVETDVLVIGGGFAGMWAAIAARQAGQLVVLVDKGMVARSGCSSFVAGIFLVCLPEDDKDEWFEEMVVGGEYLNEQEWVKLYLTESYERAMEVDGWAHKYGKQVIERDAGGAFVRRKARGHINTFCTIVQARPFVDTLKRKAKELGVKLVERVMINDLLLTDGRAGGAYGFAYRTGESYLFRAKAVVLASGATHFRSIFLGCKNITGDGVAAAYRAGAILQNMELFISNTCSAEYDIHGMNLMVSIGGEFVNALGERFMHKYSPELGSRADLNDLALAFSREVMEGRGPIYLDATSASAADRALCRKILPETFKVYDQIGYSPLDRPMKWVPAPDGQIAMGGGARITIRCETSIPGLFAAGDAAWKALNGSGGGPCGKAAGFAVVSGHRAGRFSAEYARGQGAAASQSALMDGFQAARSSFLQPILRTSGVDPDDMLHEMQELMFKCDVYYIKSEPRVQNTIERLEQIKTNMMPELWARDLHGLMKANETKNMMFVAEALFRSALVRKESRGSHFLEEYPITNNRDWLRYTLLQKDGDQMSLWSEEVPTPYLRPTEDFTTPAGIRRE
ncbi:MAG: FAD-dependent oxidoreductase [Chloroflexi bacterium]|nr:FAD-dependent oxidoreductase [Chloroflexota bacterium]